MTMRGLHVQALFLAMLTMTAAIAPGCGGLPEDEAIGEHKAAIKNPTPVALTDLTGMVEVRAPPPGLVWGGSCSGMMISENAVLTAAHCVCTQNAAGGNICATTADVSFRPSAPGQPALPPVAGSAVWHPGYGVTLLDSLDPSSGYIAHDLAVITIPLGSMPPHVTPFRFASANPPIGAEAMLAGFGHTGSDCSGALGTLNWDSAVVGGYEGSGQSMTFVSDEWCDGDSGGAALLPDGTLSPNRLFGVISSAHPINGANKAMSTWSHRDWIQSQVVDRTEDLLWGGPGWAIWTTANGGYLGGTSAPVTPEWWIAGAGDFNGDGWSDILWRNNNGALLIYFMREATHFASFGDIPVPTNDWDLRAVADVSGDRIADLVWHNRYSGEVYVWTMSETGPVGYGSLGVVTGGWTIRGTGDFNHDGKDDLFWTLATTETHTSIWLLNGTSVLGYRSLSLPTIARSWSFKGIGRLKGSTYKDDIVWRDWGGNLLSWHFSSDSGSVINVSQSSTGWAGTEWDLKEVADINGDGTSDFVWFRSSDRLLWGWLLDTSGAFLQGTFIEYAAPGWSLRTTGTFN